MIFFFVNNIIVIGKKKSFAQSIYKNDAIIFFSIIDFINLEEF